jgi:hypothetical protein
VSGLRLIVDLAKPPGQRVMQVTESNGEPLSLTKVYTLVVPEYAASGHDGFDCFLDHSVKHCYHEDD